MKFTLNWLKDHLDTRADLETVTRTLTAVGLEVEDVSDPGAALGGIRRGLCIAHSGTALLPRIGG